MATMSNRLTLKGSGTNYELEIDGEPVAGVTKLTLVVSATNIAHAVMEVCFFDLDIDVECEIEKDASGAVMFDPSGKGAAVLSHP